MKRNLKVLILGKGNIGKGVSYYLKKFKVAKRVAFLNNENKINDFDILIGVLPSRIGKNGLRLALKHKKDLIDVSAVDIPFYLKLKKEILKREIRVIPGCGFDPGLVNLILGFESQKFERINKIEISAGTLPTNTNFFFPFTWCFEDLIEGHLFGASLIKNGKSVDLSPFAGYKREKLKGVGEFESYFIEEWSSLPYTIKPKNLSFRVIRPIGFFHFFQYLKNYGFFQKKNISFAKNLFGQKKVDNTTLALIKISGTTKGKKREVSWKIFSFAKKGEFLNSMQKITAIVPVVIIKLFLKDKIKDKGILFMEEIGRNKDLFKEALKELKKEKSLTFLRKLI